MNILKSILSISLAAGLAGAAASASAMDPEKGIAKIEIQPQKITLSTGGTTQLRAIVRFADGSTKDVTDDADTVWNTSNTSVATVSKTGVVTALKAGMVDISAGYKSEKGDEHFLVVP